MPVSRRVLTTVVTLVLVLATTLSVTGATASTVEDLASARQRLATARNAANEAVAAFTEAENKLAETAQRIEELQASIDDLKAKASVLQDVVRQRAVYAYTHKGQNLDLVVDAQNPIEAARRTTLLDRANERDNTAVRKLAAINEDLREQQEALRAQETQEQAVKDQLEIKAAELQTRLAEAQQAANALQAQLDREIAAAVAAVNAARQRELEAERAQIRASQAVTNVGAGQVIGAPIGGFTCPLSGSAYSNDFGGARGHGGIDMFAPTGTPSVAVKSGTVRYVANEGAGGNAAYLSASDGNVYFYAHFSQFVGGARSVSQGEIIGLVGSTGNASAPHLHFEIRSGGVNGGKVNPYPTLKGSGC